MKTNTMPKSFILLLFALLLFNASNLWAQATVYNWTVVIGERPLLVANNANVCFLPDTYLSPGIDAKSRYFETTLSGTGFFTITKICGGII